MEPSIVLRAGLALFACIWVACSGQTGAGDASPLEGIWAATVRFGPAVRGDVSIDVSADSWRLTLGQFSMVMAQTGAARTATLPGGAGEFRIWVPDRPGRVDAAAERPTPRPAVIADSVLHGEWIQPRGRVHFSSYATPVELRQSAAHRWTGRIEPLDDRATFYVLVRRARGTLRAFIHNPEFNWMGRVAYTIELKNDAVILQGANDVLRGRYDRQRDTLTLPLLDLSPPVAPLELRRMRATEAVGLFARAGAAPASYVHRQPERRDDGWQTATLAEVGIDEQRVSALVRRIVATDPADVHAMAIHSLLVARHGKLALDEYFYGTTADQPHDMRSAGKTWAPMLVGVIRDHGGRVDAASPVLPLFREYQPLAHVDDRKMRMTVGDLMTMTSGLACDDNDRTSAGGEDRMQDQQAQPDWYKYTLDLPMARDPGGAHAIYCSAGLNLVGGVAREVARVPLPELFDADIARPLQFGRYHLNLMPTGDAYMGGGAYVRPRDQLKLGQVYLSGGTWNGRRVIDPAWVAASVERHSTFAPVNEMDANHGYGYGWHVHDFTVNGRQYREYAAEGNGGQLVMVVPDLDMVVEIGAGNYGDRDWYRWALTILPDYLIPAASQPKQE